MNIQDLENIATIIGEPARAKILWSLLDGKAYTATELSHFSDTSPQGVSAHLSKMVQAGLLKVEAQGRHRYYRFSSVEVAYAIEALGSLTNLKSNNHAPVPQIGKQDPIKYCRTCYDHLAGKGGVAIHDKLLEMEYIRFDNKKYLITEEGKNWFAGFSIFTEEMEQGRRALARPCLDWSERKYHLAGSLGTAMLNSFLQEDYIRRTKGSRIIIVTSKGSSRLYDLLKLEI
jgi:DNA-binding transcriptional ArsR family regulator